MPLVVTTLEAGASLTGRLVGTGLADELHDRRYLLLEGDDRRLHYLLHSPPSNARGAPGGCASATSCSHLAQGRQGPGFGTASCPLGRTPGRVGRHAREPVKELIDARPVFEVLEEGRNGLVDVVSTSQ